MEKKLLVVIIVCMILITSGCSNEVNINNKYLMEYTKEIIQTDMLTENEKMADIYYTENEVVFFTFIISKHLNEDEIRHKFYKINLENKEQKEMILGLSPKEKVIKFSRDYSGNIVIITSMEEALYLKKYDLDGYKIMEKEITDEIKELDPFIGLEMDYMDNFYCIGLNEIKAFDKDGKHLKTFISDMFGSTYMNDKGEILIEVYSESNENYIGKIDVSSDEIKKIKDLEDTSEVPYEYRINDMCTSKFWDYYGITDQIFYARKNNNIFPLFSWNDLDINPERLYGICEVNDREIVILDEGKELIYLKPNDMDSNEADNTKKMVYIAGNNIPEYIKDATFRFNQTNEIYKMKVIDYSNVTEEEKQMDITMNGEIDLICLEGFSKQNFINKNFLCDLNLFFDKDDELKKDDLIDSIINLLSNDGHIYSLSPGFAIDTMMCKTSMIQNKNSFSMKEIYKLNETVNDGQSLFYTLNKPHILFKILQSNLDSFLDYQKKECYFDNGEFQEILEFLKGIKDISSDDKTMPQMVIESQLIFVQERLTDFTNFMFYRKMFGEDISYVGYPSYADTGNILDFCRMEIGILESSQNKEGAWEFLKFILSEEYLFEYCQMDFFPIRKDVIHTYIELMSVDEEYTDKEGITHEPYTCTIGYDDYEVQVGPLTQKDVDTFWAICSDLRLPVNDDEELFAIILGEAEEYFNGSLSIEKCIDNIMKRAGVYINE